MKKEVTEVTAVKTVKNKITEVTYKEKDKVKDKDINTMASPVIKNVDKEEKKTGIRSIGDLLKEFQSQNEGKKLPANYWQSRALEFMEKLKVPEKDRSIIFKYFKANLSLMESICSYILESRVPIKKPTAYILYEYKRRRTK